MTDTHVFTVPPWPTSTRRNDLERHVAELGARGITTATIETVPGLFRKAAIADPDGNVITFAEDLSA